MEELQGDGEKNGEERRGEERRREEEKEEEEGEGARGARGLKLADGTQWFVPRRN